MNQGYINSGAIRLQFFVHALMKMLCDSVQWLKLGCSLARNTNTKRCRLLRMKFQFFSVVKWVEMFGPSLNWISQNGEAREIDFYFTQELLKHRGENILREYMTIFMKVETLCKTMSCNQCSSPPLKASLWLMKFTLTWHLTSCQSLLLPPYRITGQLCTLRKKWPLILVKKIWDIWYKNYTNGFIFKRTFQWYNFYSIHLIFC
jgi:hypothetical protein